MIKNVKFGNILNCKEKNIAFVVNKEGICDSEFAKHMVKNGWSDLGKEQHNELGNVISKTINDKTYYGLICYSLRKGWENQKEIIQQCFNKIETNDDIATIEIGNNDIHKLQGANLINLKIGIQRSDKNVVIYKKVNR